MKIKVQFSVDGACVGPSFFVSADANSMDLKNTLKNICPESSENDYQFVVNKRIVDTSLISDCLEGTGVSLETVFVVDCIKTEIFIVRPVTRTAASLSGHQGPVLVCRFSNDGSYLATGSGDKSVRLWDMSTMTPIRVLSGHQGWVLALSWSACGKFLASGDSQGVIIIWSKDGEKRCTFAGHKKYICCLSWQPTLENPALASSSKDGTCRIWSVARETQEACMSHMDSVSSVKFTQDKVITSSHDKTVKIWSLNGQLLRTLKLHSHWVNSMSTNMDFHDRIMNVEELSKKISRPSTLQIASCSDDNTIGLFKESTDDNLRLVGHQGVVNQVMFSPNGKYLASASFDKAVKIWDTETGKFLGNLRGHVGQVLQLAWSADSKHLISASKDATAKLWSIASMKLRADLPGHLDEVYCVDWSPLGDYAATGGKDQKVLMYSF